MSVWPESRLWTAAGPLVALELPWPPSVNHYWGTHGKMRYIKPEGRQFRSDVWKIALMQSAPKLPGDVQVAIVCYPPDKRIRDIDNLSKAVLDSLAYANVYANDHQVKRLYIENRQLRGGFIEVYVQSVLFVEQKT